MLAWPTTTRWRLWVPPDLPGGRRVYPSSLLTAYRGKPLAAASSSSRPFLKVLIGTGASEARSLVGDLWWVQWPRGFVVSLSIRRCRHLFLLYFLFLFFGRDYAASPQHLSLDVSFGCFVCFVYKVEIGRASCRERVSR